MGKYLSPEYKHSRAVSYDVIATSTEKAEINEVKKSDGIYYDITVGLDSLKRY